MRLIHGDYEQSISYCKDKLGGDFFEFDLPYVPAAETFREIDRFLWESRHQCTRFQNRYEGRAVIDITDWNAHFPNDYFEAFLYFLKGSEAHLTCTLISSEPYSEQVLQRVRRLFPVRQVQLDPSDRRPSRGSNVIGFSAESEEVRDDV